MARKAIHAVLAALEEEAGRHFAKPQRSVAIIVDCDKGEADPQQPLFKPVTFAWILRHRQVQ